MESSEDGQNPDEELGDGNSSGAETLGVQSHKAKDRLQSLFLSSLGSRLSWEVLRIILVSSFSRATILLFLVLLIFRVHSRPQPFSYVQPPSLKSLGFERDPAGARARGRGCVLHHYAVWWSQYFFLLPAARWPERSEFLAFWGVTLSLSRELCALQTLLISSLENVEILSV